MSVQTSPAIVAPRPESEPQDVRRALARYLDDLSPISARATRSFEFPGGVEDEKGRLEENYLRRHYSGAEVIWRHSSEENYSQDLAPSGQLVMTSLFHGGKTETYDKGAGGTSVLPFFRWYSDLYPEAYLLFSPPIPFRHFLSTATVENPSDSERSRGADHVVVIENPALEFDQRLRVAVDEEPFRILSSELHYTNRDGDDVLLERYRYSDWTDHNGQQFPLTHVKELISKGRVWTTRTLKLADLGFEPPPEHLMVASGSTYGEPSRRERVIGTVPSTTLADRLEELVAWCSEREGSRVFFQSGAAPEGSAKCLRDWRPDAERVPAIPTAANYECGPDTLALAIALQLGVGADYRCLDPLLAIASESGGTTLRQLADAARRGGLHADLVRTDIDGLLKRGLPAILPVELDLADGEPDHFVLLAGESGGEAVLMNPPTPSFVVARKWLETYWKGDALLLGRDSMDESTLRLDLWSVAIGLGGLVLIAGAVLWKR